MFDTRNAPAPVKKAVRILESPDDYSEAEVRQSLQEMRELNRKTDETDKVREFFFG